MPPPPIWWTLDDTEQWTLTMYTGHWTMVTRNWTMLTGHWTMVTGNWAIYWIIDTGQNIG